MQTMQDKLTEEFRRLAEDEAGLEFVTDARDTPGIWYVMDGLDTRIVIYHEFRRTRIDMSLEGQAVQKPDLDFFKARQLRPEEVPSSSGKLGDLSDLFGGAAASSAEGLRIYRKADQIGFRREVKLIAEYGDGERLRRALGVVRDLLAPYAKKSGAQAPQDP
jgi:hypothetical protein